MTTPKKVIEPGMQFGMLTFIKELAPKIGPDKTIHKALVKRRLGLFQCDCGNTKELLINDLYGKDARKSCGCLRLKGKQKSNKSSEHISCSFVNSYKKGAEERNLEFKITAHDVEKIYIKQGGKCFYTGQQLPEYVNEKKKQASIDRFDNTKGYLPDNIILCCPRFNMMKYTDTYEDFVKNCRRVVNHYDKINGG